LTLILDLALPMKRTLMRLILSALSDQTFLAKTVAAAEQRPPPLWIKHKAAIGAIHALFYPVKSN
jgi:hypothetical protein